jgi:hypothetical protein
LGGGGQTPSHPWMGLNDCFDECFWEMICEDFLGEGELEIWLEEVAFMTDEHAPNTEF